MLRLFLLVSFVLSFGVGCPTPPEEEPSGPGVGKEGGPCDPDGECFGDLTCASNVCVDLGGVDGTADGSSTDAGLTDGSGDGTTDGTPPVDAGSGDGTTDGTAVIDSGSSDGTTDGTSAPDAGSGDGSEVDAGPQCSACPAGTSLNTTDCSCVDINECDTNNGGCAHNCTNSDGAFACSCDAGYELDTDGHTCNDVDECTLETDNCPSHCQNTVGGFTCGCGIGYEEVGDNCNDINECTDNSDNCEYGCANTPPGSYTCTCAPGHEVQSDGYSCALPPFESTELLGRPTDKSITVQVIGTESLDAYVEFGTESGTYTENTPETTFADGMVEIVLDGLLANTRYYYRLRYRNTGDMAWLVREPHSFHTQRAQGSAFKFTVQSDSHQGWSNFYNDALYAIAMANQSANEPDFQFDLGDAVSLNFSTETTATARTKYLNQRVFFDNIAHSIPVFLVVGNHENEEAWNLDDYGNTATDVQYSLPVLSANARKRYFLNPVPDDFYTGNADDAVTLPNGTVIDFANSPVIEDGLKETYFSFEWGDALFVTLDPYWYTIRKPFSGSMGGEINDETDVGTRWDWTLGYNQYQWLKNTLEQSDAKFKFVFAHHITGGTQDYSRGGVEGAAYNEWGGRDNPEINSDMPWTFNVNRPTFEMPIHQMMAANGVTLFFHGHDHVFAREALDGVVYVEVPHTANAGYGTGFDLYTDDGEETRVINNSGHILVSVTPDDVTFDYVRAFLPEDENSELCDLSNITGCYKNGASYYTETIPALASNSKPVAVADTLSVATSSVDNEIFVLTNDSDPDNTDTLTVIGVSQPSHGTVTALVGDDDRVIYTPDPGYCDDANTDTFSYIIGDGNGRTASAIVVVSVPCTP